MAKVGESAVTGVPDAGWASASVVGVTQAAPRTVHRGWVEWKGKRQFWVVYSNGLITAALDREAIATRINVFRARGV
jgi:hypothetical protein